ncbi:hypothetical protein PVK06_038964 [Gossypium arboreum]|uniref:DUF4283 domain-containing protein n=1 Tax=Gossypium arboreum TaxID=29729 RepID=A0ABR0N3J3_GOSAR|nr:hypothetical protein PVK06_038964 [Gossypium arboreum]
MDFATDVRRSTKKVKRRMDEPLDPDNPVVNEKGIRVDGASIQLVSWKEKLMGSASVGVNVQQEEGFQLDDGDVKAVVIDGVPSITFSDRVHQFIAKRMAITVIVKLLGRKFSFFAMVNKLQTIWRMNQPLQIIHLENDYFSVKFQTDEEYLEALAGGPWTIFGH